MSFTFMIVALTAVFLLGLLIGCIAGMAACWMFKL